MKIYKNLIFRSVLFAVFMALSLKSFSQEGIKLAASFEDNKLHVTWIPVNDTIWVVGKTSGYSISRTDEYGHKTILARNIKPMAKVWFDANKGREAGLVEAIGEFLYNPANAEDNGIGELTNQNIQFNMLAPEAISNPAIAECIGLGYADSTGVDGKHYVYEVTLTDISGKTYSATLDVQYGESYGSFNLSELFTMQFKPYGGKSLSQMMPDYDRFDRIEVSAKSYGDSIVLRWAPNNQSFWAETKGEPYAIFREKQVMTKDSSYTDYIFLDSIGSWKLEQFTPDVVSKDSLILIAAQSMYGPQESTEADGIITQYAESSMRYGMAMLAADRSPLAATALGLRYVDRNVKPGEAYTYFILSRAAGNITQQGYVAIQNKVDTISGLGSFFAESGDGTINLVWSQSNDQLYSGYLIERSEDGGRSFQPLINTPLLFIQNQFDRGDGFYQFRDSLTINYKEYRYRLIGVDAFGDRSKPIEVKAHSVDKTPPDMPVIYYAEAENDGSIGLKWEMPAGNDDLQSFHILLGNDIDGNYEPIATDLGKSTRSYKYSEPLNTERAYFFIIVAQDTAGNQRPCQPVYVHLIDSIAPAAPLNVKGMIDSSGIVTLAWDHGTEPDLIGYRVYMANNPDHEFAQLTKEAIAYNTWNDTITLKSLDKKVYYKVVAVDRSENYSAFSEILSLNRPDIIPPAPPASLPTSSDENGVLVRWTPSSSNDVVAYIVFRRNVDHDTTYTRIARLQDKNATQWLDTTAVYDNIYQYMVKAQDQSGLLSRPSFPVNGRRSFDINSLKISGFIAAYRKEYNAVYLRWNAGNMDMSGRGGSKLYLYKKIKDGNWKKINQLDASYSSYLDRDLKTEGTFIYGIKIVTAEGLSGAIVESSPVIYKK